MSGWFLLASAIVQYQRKIEVIKLKKAAGNTGVSPIPSLVVKSTYYAWKLHPLVCTRRFPYHAQQREVSFDQHLAFAQVGFGS